MKNILFIVGSLREGSFNHQMAKEAEKILEGVANVTYLDYKNIPLMNQDIENPVLESVQSARDSVVNSDAIWLFSPVYNAAIPGVAKNLIDWLSRALDPSDQSRISVLTEKTITVSSVASSGQEETMESYKALLSFVRMKMVGEFTTAKINPEAWGTGELKLSDEVIDSLKKQAKALIEA